MVVKPMPAPDPAHRPVFPRLTWRRFLRSFAAVVTGNAIYFAVLLPYLPPWLRHRPMGLDAGLLLDFLICVVLYVSLVRVLPPEEP
jgi:hypothetical protein